VITRLLRLHQVACGFLPVDDGEQGAPVCDGVNPRLVALSDVIEQGSGKVIIWATYNYSISEIATYLAQNYGKQSYVVYDGSVSTRDRITAVDRFQNDDTVRFFVGKPSSGGTGITLTAASRVVYYSNDYSLINRLQSEDRAHRIGQDKTVFYTDLEAVGTVDSRIIAALNSKKDIASELNSKKLVAWLEEI